MDRLLSSIRADYPQLRFAIGKTFCWSPDESPAGQIFYKQDAAGPTAVFSLLHETGHALLAHRRYKLDFELLEMEVAAWERAKLLAGQYGISIDNGHVEDCLDSYRDWLYRRSICPSCTAKALQMDDIPEYRCHNCRATWRVTASRFCRPYRQTTATAKGESVPVFSSHF